MTGADWGNLSESIKGGSLLAQTLIKVVLNKVKWVVKFFQKWNFWFSETAKYGLISYRLEWNCGAFPLRFMIFSGKG